MTVDTLGTPNRHESPKTMTITRMATAARLMIVTVDTFYTPNMYGRSKNDDNYEDGDRDPLDPCDC